MAYSVDTDRKWQKRWDETKLYAFDPKAEGKKLYCLEMFCYPSGANLHLGHWYNYSLTDSWARMKRMQGYHLFHPMGFDAFGLPAENYAIKTGIHPQDSTLKNIKTMKRQIQEMGASYDWDYEIATCLPAYYRWNQWLFLRLLEKGLAYRKKAPVNWCSACQTVLANEQVIDGRCERCETDVIRKNMTQWFFAITRYAQELLDDLPDLDWPERTKKIQTNWIGRSEGAQISFYCEKDHKPLLDEANRPIRLDVFTTRADTFMGCTYVVVAPESDICEKLVTDEQKAAVDVYRNATAKVSDIDRMATTREKTGVFTGSYAIHPLTNEKLPIWASDYVIAGYGTGIVMAVPAHDERDFEFATTYKLMIRRVIASSKEAHDDLPFCEPGVLVDSSNYTGLSSKDGGNAIVDDLSKIGMGEHKVTFRLRDWLISRQRYWGTPIPIVYCETCGTVPVPDEKLPIELPYDVTFSHDGESPLKKNDAFVTTTCPRCHKPAKRETDTMDTFVDSSWYQLRYTDPKNDTQAFDPAIANRLCPVDKYVGGPEHAAMHLLYARFICKALRDLGYVNFDEPFTSLVHQGIILGPDGNRMSKSKGNTIAPDVYISQFGSDVFRTYLAFGFAYTEGGPWNDNGLQAIVKFVGRIERLADDISKLKKDNLEKTPDWICAKDLHYVLHYTIRAVTQDTERFQFNTSVARLMELMNAINKYQLQKDGQAACLIQAYDTMLLLYAPFAPHLCEDLWEKLGHDYSIFDQVWPTYDPQALVLDTVEIAVQINGQVKFKLDVPADISAEAIEKMVRSDERLPDVLAGRTIIKCIYVKGRLVNLVVK